MAATEIAKEAGAGAADGVTIVADGMAVSVSGSADPGQRTAVMVAIAATTAAASAAISEAGSGARIFGG